VTTTAPVRSARTPQPGEAQHWSDAELVRECLRGREEAWAALLEKYKKLIYSIPLRYGFSRDDATDLFQEICVDLLSELPALREPRALAKWIIQITAHRCVRRLRQQQAAPAEADDRALALAVDQLPLGDEILREYERREALCEAIAGLPPRCRALVHALFFETPARPYEELAREFGIACGSVGFVRARCLERLRRQLLKNGFL